MMRAFAVSYIPAALRDLEKLNPSVAREVLKKIEHVALNPRAVSRGGYGHPLSGTLAGFFKIKLRSRGLRVVYKLRESEGAMTVIVVAARAGGEVYAVAEQRIRRLNL